MTLRIRPRLPLRRRQLRIVPDLLHLRLGVALQAKAASPRKRVATSDEVY